MSHNKRKNINYINSDRIERLLHIGYWNLNLKTQELYWSDEIYNIYGLSRDTFELTFENVVNCYHPDDKQKIFNAFDDLIERGTDHMMQARLIHADGSIRTIIATCTGEYDSDGNITAASGTIQDVTDYVEDQERYERAVLGSGTAIWDWDMQSDQIHWLGHSYLTLGYVSKDKAPQNAADFFSRLIHEEYELPLKHAIDIHLKDKKELELNVRIRKADGNAIWTIIRAQAQWNIHDQPVRLSGSFTNIDALKHAEDKLLRSNHDLEQFASVAAHDLQQPLRTISGFLELVVNEQQGNLTEKSKEYIRTCIEGAGNMSALVNDLLEYSRLETDGLQKENTDLTKIIQEAIRPIKHIIYETEAELDIGDMPTLPCDRYKMQRVFTNLIENALKYRKKDGTPPHIEISSRKWDECWVISVKDNGIGMEKKNLDTIFQMFSRLHSKDEYSGTGIGLSICRKIVNLHDGRIWAESTPGEGSTFYVEIPS